MRFGEGHDIEIRMIKEAPHYLKEWRLVLQLWITQGEIVHEAVRHALKMKPNR